jgi:hypothetical protein
LLTANIDPYALSLEEYYRYLEKLEVKHNIDKALRDDKKRKADRNDGDGEKGQGILKRNPKRTKRMLIKRI